jgi:epoxyqueuosine reductase
MAGGRAGVADLCGPRLLNKAVKLSGADLKAALAHEAATLGFDSIGVTGPDTIGNAGKYFREFLDAGAHGDMDWLAAQPERRMDPRVLWPGVRSIIMLGVNYGPDVNPLALLEQRTRGAISAYAQGDDYHDVIKKRLKTLARWLVATSGEEVKVFIDTAAVMEKPLAQAAGLGWQGKHTNLVSRGFGSWLFLGAIFSASDLPRDAADIDHCGSCNACQEICPTAAFPAPYKLDFARASATASMAATIALPCALGTNLRKLAAKPSSPHAMNCAHRRFASWRGSTTPRFACCFRNRRSSASAATVLSATC